MTLPFRSHLVLLALGGDHASDPAAFVRRCRAIQAIATRSRP